MYNIHCICIYKNEKRSYLSETPCISEKQEIGQTLIGCIAESTGVALKNKSKTQLREMLSVRDSYEDQNCGNFKTDNTIFWNFIIYTIDNGMVNKMDGKPSLMELFLVYKGN